MSLRIFFIFIPVNKIQNSNATMTQKIVLHLPFACYRSKYQKDKKNAFLSNTGLLPKLAMDDVDIDSNNQGIIKNPESSPRNTY